MENSTELKKGSDTDRMFDLAERFIDTYSQSSKEQIEAKKAFFSREYWLIVGVLVFFGSISLGLMCFGEIDKGLLVITHLATAYAGYRAAKK